MPATAVDKRGRRIARETYPDTQPCEVCGKTGRGRGVIDRHHRNSDRLDNRAENIAFLCRKHHQGRSPADGRTSGRRTPAPHRADVQRPGAQTSAACR